MKKLFKNFGYTRVALTIIVISSIATFYGVFKILKMHQTTIARGAKTDVDFIHIVKNMEKDDRQCQDRLKIIELENKIMKEQLETLFEFHEHDKARAKIKYLD